MRVGRGDRQSCPWARERRRRRPLLRERLDAPTGTPPNGGSQELSAGLGGRVMAVSGRPLVRRTFSEASAETAWTSWMQIGAGTFCPGDAAPGESRVAVVLRHRT